MVWNGGPGNDSYTGSGANDEINGNGGNDTLHGMGGRDLINGGIGNDVLTGGTGNDTLLGESGNDGLLGDDGNDSIDGGIGNDGLMGGIGNDTLIGGTGANQLLGGAGNDLIVSTSLSDSIDGDGDFDSLVIDLSGLFTALDLDLAAVWTGGVGTYGLGSIEGIEALSSLDATEGDDTITIGDAYTGNTVIDSHGGNDTVIGGGGRDVVSGGAGDDSLSGSLGEDALFGEASDDTLAGGEGDDALDGGSGADQLDGGDHDDALTGGSGLDSLNGGAGNDTLNGVEWNETAIGGLGTDQASLNLAQAATGVNLNLSSIWSTGSLAMGLGSLAGVERITHVTGTALADQFTLGTTITDAIDIGGGGGNDTLNGGGGGDTLRGGDGANAINGRGGNDLLISASSADTVIGGDGADTISIDWSGEATGRSAAIERTAGAISIGVLGGGNASAETLAGFVATSGNDSLAYDLLYPQGYADPPLTLGLGAGNDVLQIFTASFTNQTGPDVASILGGAGDDSVVAADGDYTFIGGSGTDTFRGGTYGRSTVIATDLLDDLDGGFSGDLINEPFDTLVVDLGAETVGVNLAITQTLAANNTETLHIGSLVARNFEYLSRLTLTQGNDTVAFGNWDTFNPSGYSVYGRDEDIAVDLAGGDDHFTIGNAAVAVTVHGGAGNDYIAGGAWRDILYGDDGADTLIGGLGDDVLFITDHSDSLDGGNDGEIDVLEVDFRGAAAGQNLVINPITAAPFSFAGNSVSNFERYGTIHTSNINDTVFVEGNINFVDHEGYVLDITIVFLNDGDDYYNSNDNSDFVSGGSGDDTIYGNNGHDSIYSGSGNDFIDAGTGDDLIVANSIHGHLDGGAGYDKLDIHLLYETAGAAIDLSDLWTLGTATIGGATAENFEDLADIRTTQFDDSVIVGNSAENMTAYLFDGNDSYSGGNGSDHVAGLEGDDSIDGSGGNDDLTGYDGSDTLVGSAGNDSLDGESGGDLLQGGDGDDVIYAPDGTDTIDGGAGNDWLVFNPYYSYQTTSAMLLDISMVHIDGTVSIDGHVVATGIENIWMENGLTAGNDTIIDGAESRLLDAGYGNDIIHSGGGTDTIYGNHGDDTLHGGGTGATLMGAGGNDVYHVHGLEEVIEYDIIVLPGEPAVHLDLGGTDTVFSHKASIGLTEFIENLILVEGEALSAVGNAQANTITGNTAANTINGIGGADTLLGGNGNDLLQGGDDNDRLDGGGHNDTLEGGNGDDDLDGGTGADTLIGGSGNDRYHLRGHETLVEMGNGGFDTVISYVAAHTLGFDFEHLELSGAVAISGTGNGAANRITGNGLGNIVIGLDGADTLLGGGGNDDLQGGAGADELDGEDGDDTLSGGDGDDRYVVRGHEILSETATGGIDTVVSHLAAYTLLANFEHMELAEGAAAKATGNALANLLQGNANANVLTGGGGSDTLIGGDGADSLAGGTGADLLQGGAGNDVYFVADASDTVNETGTDSADEVRVGFNYTLGDGLDVLRLQGSATTGTGNGLDNRLIGNSGGNLLAGLGGADKLYGYGGADTLQGGTGDDFLYGGGGIDQIYGGAGRDILKGDLGADVFWFDDGDGAGLDYATADRIMDFTQGTDRINLSLIDAIAGGADDVFTFIGSAAFTGLAGQLRYIQSPTQPIPAPEWTLILGDTNGDGVADFAIGIAARITPVITDFIL